MKTTIKGLTLLYLLSACATQDNPAVESSVSPQLTEAPTLQFSLESLVDEVNGASSGTQRFQNESVKANLSFGPYFFLPTNGNQRFNLSYQKASGDYIFAHIWYYHAQNKHFEILSPGWHYNKNNLNAYTGTFTLPSQASHVYVGFFSFKGGAINATLETADAANSNTSDMSLQSSFQTAINQAQGQLGSAKSNIVEASSVSAYKQDFEKGIVLLKKGQSTAYAIYGPIYEKWVSTGNTQRYGLPTSVIQTGRTLNGKSSQYQLFDKPGSPSLHNWEKGSFMFLEGIRNLWNQGDNATKLGHPTSDEENGSQSFENGRIDWNYGSPRLLTTNNSIENTCFYYAVGNPPGSFSGYKNDQGFQKFNYSGYGWHLGDDLNGKSGGDKDLGDPVYAIGNGEVTAAKNYGQGWGNIIFVKHQFKGRTITSMYAHLKDINVKPGQFVQSKQQIGTIGKGFNNEYVAHLHLELRENGETKEGPGYTKSKVASGPQAQIDPEKFISNNYCK